MSAKPLRTRDPGRTRERILDSAQELILEQGFSATSVDAVVTQAGITKGAFFHHFASKSDLALALVERYARLDREHLEAQWALACAESDDPLARLLALIRLYEEEFEAMPAPFPGCLFASFVYESKLFDEGTLAVLRESILFWRRSVREILERVLEEYPPKIPVHLDSLADLFYALPEGAFVMTKALGDRTLLARQTRHLRNHMLLLFGEPATRPSSS